MKNSPHKTLSIIILLFFNQYLTHVRKKKTPLGHNKGGELIRSGNSGVTVVLNQQNTIPGTNPIDNLRKTG